MGDRLTDSQMFKLVEIYHDYQCLWDYKSSLYKNQDARDSAYKQIAERLNISGITARDIPKKIKNLRSSYSQEIKKIERSTRSGAGQEYTPKVSWFTTADGFLRSIRNKQIMTFSNNYENSNAASDTDNSDNDSVSEEAPIEIVEVDIREGAQDQLDTSSYSIPSTSNQTPKKRGKAYTKQDEIHEAINKLDNIAENITRTTQSLIQNKEDEFEDFGKYIASTLRSLPPEFSIIAKTDIQKALSEVQLKALKHKTQSSLVE